MRLAKAPLVLGILGMLVQREALAQYKVAIEPAIDVTQVHDDNLFSSAVSPAQDLILRVTPSLALRVESPRWSVGGAFGFDSERFANHSNLTNSRARQRGSLGVSYRFDPRLTIALNGGYTDTDTPGDLNLLTGLGATRVRVQQLTFGPSARYRISPRTSAHAAFSLTDQKSAGAPGMNTRFETVGIGHRITPRDEFTADYEHSRYLFTLAGSTSTSNTHVLRGGWTHNLNAATTVTLQAGPRITDHSIAPELAVSVTHAWQFSSIAISAMQTQTTAIGSVGTIETRGVQARFTYEPTRPLTVYAAPAVARNVQRDLQATVYWIGLGARYAITPLTGFDVAYSFNSQKGSINALQANRPISRSVLSVAFTTRWSAPDRLGTGRR
jgi:hypothetical protein